MKIAICAALLACSLPCAAAALSGAGTPSSPYDDGAWASTEVAAAPLTPEKGPADQYFGRFKFSNLEVRNTVHDLRIIGNSPAALQTERFRIEEARSALVMWNDLYPRDPWLSSTIVQFADELHQKGQADLDMTSLYLYLYLAARYDGHYFGKASTSRLNGFAPAAGYDLTTIDGPYPPLVHVADAKYPSPK